MRRLLLVLMVVLAVAAAGFCDTPSMEDEPQAKAAFQALREGRYTDVREIAERMVAADPDSPIGNALLGQCYMEAEGSLPRALFYLKRARTVLERRYTETIPQDGPWRVHLWILNLNINALEKMEAYPEEMTVLDAYNRLYKPPHLAQYGWPLMKLGRYDEAEKKMLVVLQDPKPTEEQETTALNTLGAITSMRGETHRSYGFYKQQVDEIDKHHWTPDSNALYNAAQAAIDLGQGDEAEQLLLQATRIAPVDDYSNPWLSLADLYLTELRLPEMATAIANMHQWDEVKTALTMQQQWAEHMSEAALALLLLDQTDKATDMMRHILSRPDRNASGAWEAWRVDALRGEQAWDIFHAQREHVREEMSWCSWGSWARDLLAGWDLDRELGDIVSRVGANLVPNESSDDPFAGWINPDLPHLLGPGVVKARIQTLLAKSGENADLKRPYLRLVLGACLVGQKDWGAAVTALQAALHDLPHFDREAQSQARALLGQALLQNGQAADGLAALAQVLNDDPGLIRRFDLALPVTIQTEGGAAAAQAGTWLGRSPRFVRGDGFTLSIFESDTGLQGRLLGPDGSVLRTVSTPAVAGDFCRQFHAAVFGPRLDMSQLDVNSLDGSNQAGASQLDVLKLLQPGHK